MPTPSRCRDCLKAFSLVTVLRYWNSGNGIVFDGKDGDRTGPDREHTETSMLSLHLPQPALVHINTLPSKLCFEVPEFHDSIGPNQKED